MKKKVMLLLYILIFQIFSINQEQIAFAEIANVQNEEKINNNSFNETEISPSISGFGYGIEAINPYEINIGDNFELSYPYIDGRAPNGDLIHPNNIKMYWYGGTPIFANKLGDTATLIYEYKSPSYDQYLSIPVKVVARDGRRAKLKSTKLYVGQKWDLESIFEDVRDRDGNPLKPEQVKRVWINDSLTGKIDTSKPGVNFVQIGVSSPRTKPLVYSDRVLVTVEEDKTKAKLKDTELYVGQKWDLESVFENVVDKDGNPIKSEEVKNVWIDGQKTREIDTSKPGKHTVKIAVLKANNEWAYSNVGTVIVKEDQTKAELKDTELYVGQKWGLGSVYKNVVDKDGNLIKPEDVNSVWINVQGKWIKSKEIDTSKPGQYKVQIYVQNAKYEWIKSNVGTVIVKEDQTSIKTKDNTLYVGQKWDPKDNFVNATDEDGKSIPWNDPRITKNGASIDTSKPGKHKIKYTFKGKVKNVDSEFTVTVKKDQTSIKTKDSTLYVGQKWEPKDNFVNATDEDGKSIPWNDPRITKNGASIDTSKSGKHKIKYTFKGKVKNVDSEFTVTVKKDQTKAELKDTELYVGQKWDLGSAFKNIVDKDGNLIKPEDVNSVWINVQGKWIKSKEIDTSKPGQYKVQIYVQNAKYEWIKSNVGTVIVKEDQTSIKTKDNTLYVGQKWDPKDNFVNATDEDGKSIPWNDPRITKNSASIDTSKPGKHKIKYTFKGKVKNVDSEFTVTVKKDQTSIKTKDSTLYVGQKWDPKNNFVNATDEDGKSIPWNDSRITKNGASIDTSKPGKHKIKYTFKGKVKNVDSEFTVIVKEEPFMLKHVSDFDFGEKELSLINKLVANKKENPTIEVETPSIVGKDWQLQVELSPFLDKENSKSILKGVSLFIPKGKLESDLETEEPTQYDCQLEANGKASILMQGTKTKGKGRWKNKLATKGITLSIPPENKTGNYESTLHWTLLDVPG